MAPIYRPLLSFYTNVLRLQDGNFDYPPASEIRGSQTPGSTVARFQHLRELLRTERVREQAQAGGIDEENPSRSLERRRARAIRELQSMRQGEDITPSPRPESRHSAAEPLSQRRPRARPSLRNRASEREANALSALQAAGARLVEAGSRLGGLLDQPIPRISSPDIPTQEYSGEAEVNRWRAKRRKLDSDDTSRLYRSFSYGHFGQVVPGPLRMEIVSCDGGILAPPTGENSLVENVLVNNDRVYCTKSEQCNIIVRHVGETSFSLKKLVIKAPECGFDAP